MPVLAPHPRYNHSIPTLLLMLPSVLIAAVALLSGSALGAEVGGYDYIYNGDDWQGTCKSGSNQSPIDIKTELVRPVNKNKPLFFINYDREVPYNVQVEDFTVMLTPKPGIEVGVYGGGLPGKYILSNVHFHWPGEHLINGERPILEAHFVHYKSIYNGTAEAMNDPEGIAVLGVLFVQGGGNSEIDKIQNGALTDNEALLDLGRLLPADRTNFYRYKGSLTTPPCSESVIWTIFRDHVIASDEQIATFRGLLPPKSQVQDTYRNVQPLNRRLVELWSVDENSVAWNKVQHFSPNPSLLFAVIPGLSILSNIQTPGENLYIRPICYDGYFIL